MTFGARQIAQSLFGSLLAIVSRAVTGVRPIWLDGKPGHKQRIYYANHTSHGDFILLQSRFDQRERALTYAVAGKDYWQGGPIRRFLSDRLLRTVLIERSGTDRSQDPVSVMCKALDEGLSLIIFPEGTRNMTDAPLLPFKSGLFHLAVARPDIEIIPCWIENMARVMPKGTFLPVPLLCRVIFGKPLAHPENEDKQIFLKRAENALLDLNPLLRRPPDEP